MSRKSRRTFLKSLALGAISIPIVTCSTHKKVKLKEDRIRKDQMYYRRLGRTDLYISEISLGGSPIPEWPILVQAMEKGVNYIDTSHVYQNGNSERLIGRLITEFGREKVYVGTKFHVRKNWSEESIVKTVEGSLDRLQTDHIDVLHIHGAGTEEILTDESILSAYEKLKSEGKCRFTGISCHTNHHKVVKKAIECGHYDVIQLGYNVFDIKESEAEVETHEDYLGASGIRHILTLAKSYDVGILAMKVLKVGGKRQNLKKFDTDGQTVFQMMIKWALENPNIASVNTEMLTYEQLEEDLAVVGQELSASQRTNLYRYVAENSKDYCHMCGTCQSRCPSGVRTTEILRYLAYYEGYQKYKHAKDSYAELKPEEQAGSCQDCGTCESICPYGVAVRKRIQLARSLLECG
ncbi:aldo/keto reductase [Acidobacteriota bacterium]